MPAFCTRCHTIVGDGVSSCPSCERDRPTGGWPVDELLGKELVSGQYRVRRRLGSGGFGVVYEVETVVGQLRRALKILDSRWSGDETVRNRFVNEALVLEQVNHPNVARCYAAGTLADGSLYLLLELVEGVPVSDLIRNRSTRHATPLEPLSAVRIAKQIASGLVAAHKNGVLHRDLKPENILVVDVGEPTEHVKVVDFGIAKLTEGGSTETHSLVGTPTYMAPEQFTPGATLEARMDLWQLGATLFAMLTGRPPYDMEPGQGPMSIVQQQLERDGLGPAPSERREALADYPGLDGYVARLLSTDPAGRPATAAEVTEELARIEQTLSPNYAPTGSFPLLEALCAEPSDSAWWALLGYLDGRGDDRASLVAAAGRQLDRWPDEVRIAPSAFWEVIKRGRAHPLWSLVRALDLSGRALEDEDGERLAAEPAMATITRLSLARNDLGKYAAEALSESAHLRALSGLDLSQNRLGSEGVERLTRAKAFPRLDTLVLSANGIGPAGAEALARSSKGLVHLDLAQNDIRANGAAALAAAEGLAGLRTLKLGGNGIGPDGAAALAVSAHLAFLEEIRLEHSGFGPSGAAALALSKNTTRLRRLSIARNKLGRQGLQLLLSSTSFERLEELDLSGNEIGASGAMLLASSPFGRRLRRLALSDNDLGDAGLAALLGAPHLGGLHGLAVANNQLTGRGAALLSGAPPQLVELDLSANPLGKEAAAAMSEALPAMSLRVLGLSGCALEGEALAQIIAAGGGRLTSVDASQNPLEGAGAQALARLAEIETIEELDLSATGLDAEALGALLTSRSLRNLRRLRLDSNPLGDVGAMALVRAAARLPRLRDLSLADTGIGPDAVAALAASSLTGTLERLALAHNTLGDRGAEALTQGPGFFALHEVDLSSNDVGLAGAAAVLSSRTVAALTKLDLSRNVIGGAVDVHSLAKKKIELIEQSFARVAAMGPDFAARFYDELFARYPTVKPLFSATSMSRQQQHLVAALALVVEHLRKPDALDRTLFDLGRRHLGYGTQPSHYFAVLSTLLDTLRDVLGDDWTPEVAEAWNDGLSAVSASMMRAHAPGAQAPERTSRVPTR